MSGNTGESFATVSTPGQYPKVTSIFDFSSDALGQLRLWLEQNPPAIGISNILGFAQFAAQLATQSAEAHFTSTTYADPNVSGPAGPTLSSLPDGNYVVLWGAAMQAGTSETIFMGVSVNGATPADSDALECQVTTGHAGSARGNLYSLSNGGSNTITCKYKTTLGHDSDIRKAWLMALRYSNP